MNNLKAQPLPQGWATPALGEIASINPALDRCVIHDEVNVAFVPMRAVEVDGGGLTTPETRRFAEVKKGYTAFLSGDVIMAKITPCMENGKIAVVPEVPGAVCFGSTEFHSIRPERGVNAKWIAQFLLQHETRRAAQRQMTGGVGQMRVPAHFLETLRIPLPPTAEQLRVADTLDELFSDLDAGVAALARVREKLKLYRAAVLKAAVEGTLTAEWRQQHPETEPASKLLERILTERHRRWEEDQLARFKARDTGLARNWRGKYKEPILPDTTNLPPLPEGWCWMTLSQATWSASYGTSEKCSAESTGLAVLRIPNIIGGRLDLRVLKYAPPDHSQRDEDLVHPGDLLVVRTNGSRNLIGRGAVVRDRQTIPLSYASYLIRLRLIPYASFLHWVSLIWDSFHVRRWIEARAATSAGQYNISLGVLEELVIPLPPLAEQEAMIEAVEDQLSIIDHLEADLDNKTNNARALQQSILRQAFTGQLVPQDPHDEPASELLKRIADERKTRTREATMVRQLRDKPMKQRGSSHLRRASQHK